MIRKCIKRREFSERSLCAYKALHEERERLLRVIFGYYMNRICKLRSLVNKVLLKFYTF